MLGEVYQLKATAFGFKDYAVELDVPDSGLSRRAFLWSRPVLCAGGVTRNGSPLRKCRVYWTGPTNGSCLRMIRAVLGHGASRDVHRVFNALKVIPQTKDVKRQRADHSQCGPSYGVTPIYDGFAGSSLDMSSGQYANLAVRCGRRRRCHDGVRGSAEARDGAEPRGIMSTAAFPPSAA